LDPLAGFFFVVSTSQTGLPLLFQDGKEAPSFISLFCSQFIFHEKSSKTGKFNKFSQGKFQ
jgi:hypothetical protein